MVRNPGQGQKRSGQNLTSGNPAVVLRILKHLKNFKGPGMVTATPFAKMLERKQPLPPSHFSAPFPVTLEARAGVGDLTHCHFF